MREVLLSNYLKLSKKKKKMRIRQFSEPSNEQIDGGYQLSKLMTSSRYWWIT